VKFENVIFDEHFYGMLKENKYEPAGSKDRPVDLDPGPCIENPEPLPLALTVLRSLAVADRRPVDGPNLFRWSNCLDTLPDGNPTEHEQHRSAEILISVEDNLEMALPLAEAMDSF